MRTEIIYRFRHSLWPRLRLTFLLLALALAAAGASARAEDGHIERGDGFDLYYHTVGTGQPIVLLSGGPGMDVDLLKPVADALGREYQCVLLEQRGTGRSRLKSYNASTLSLNLYIEDIEALRERLRLEKVTLLGNSWGMMLALAYAAAHPDHTRAVISMGSGPLSYDYFAAFNDNIRARLWPVDKEAEMHALRLHDRSAAAFEDLRAILPGYFYDHELGEKYAQNLTPDGFNTEINAPVMGTLFKERFDLRPALRKVTAPVLLIQGRQDPAGEANLYDAHLALSGSRMEFLEKCGHLPWVEQPDAFFHACRQFLGEVYGARESAEASRADTSPAAKDHPETHIAPTSLPHFRK